MTKTDTTERGLERLICTALTGAPCDPGGAGAEATSEVRERPAVYGAGWICGAPEDYDREHCVDLAQLAAFLEATQPTPPTKMPDSIPTSRTPASSTTKPSSAS